MNGHANIWFLSVQISDTKKCLKCKLASVRISDISGFQTSGFQTSTVLFWYYFNETPQHRGSALAQATRGSGFNSDWIPNVLSFWINSNKRVQVPACTIIRNLQGPPLYKRTFKYEDLFEIRLTLSVCKNLCLSNFRP